MKLAALRLRQRDGVTCGPTVAVVAGALLDPGHGADLSDPAWFAGEQARVHAEVNRVWPRRLGTTPIGDGARAHRTQLPVRAFATGGGCFAVGATGCPMCSDRSKRAGRSRC